LDESQLTEDWAEILSLASQPGASLEQIHIFCLAHVLRRPIIVYGVKYVKSWRGENLGYARFEGMYHTFINLVLNHVDKISQSYCEYKLHYYSIF